LSARIRFARLLATWFGCGLLPVAPGTFGSLGAIAVAWPLVHFANWAPWWLLPLAILLLPVAIWSATVTAEAAGHKDPRLVVIDEVVGQWITLSGCTRLNWKAWVLGFLLFRLFDIWKPWPIRQLERLPTGTGIVVDDCMAGVYGALVLAAAGWFNFY
jgi:phosphatidylglycerophosphatase A